ncbi:MAG: alanine--tRNA ligase [Phycisphaerales bacterium]|nr:alanine--tRNA ligase [Phycisphaerales bacterium]
MASPPTRTARQIRTDFLEFFRDRAGHEIVPSSPVVPHDDPTLLFTNAGMNQFKDVFLGTGSRPWVRAVDTQKCIRAGGKHNDLDDVGRDTWHHTFFEMLGNWSFGDYFKAEAITWAWQLLTEVWGLPKERLHVTVFAGDEADGLGPDEEAEQLWAQCTDIDPTHITRWGRKDNFWEMGASGPCGPCSEIHFDSTPDCSGAPLVNADHPDVIEIWNLVFMQFDRRSDGTLVELPARHVDTGMGLERIVRVCQGVRSNYATDLWAPLFNSIQSCTGAPAYTDDDSNPVDVAYRVVADHVRCLTVSLADGARPGPDGRGYVLRRILRRGVRMARQSLGATDPLLCRLVPTVVEELGDVFEALRSDPDLIASIIEDEERAFLRTLDRGLLLFDEAAQRGGNSISGEDAFTLHDTWGFPIDLTEQMALERGIQVDKADYEARMDAARALSRAGGGADAAATLPPDAIAGLEALGAKPTDDAAKFHDKPVALARIVGLWDGTQLVDQLHGACEGIVILDRTTFYGEQGGQIGDTGRLITEAEGATHGGATFQVTDTQRAGDWVLHIGRVSEGDLRRGDHVTTRVNVARRSQIEANHTATHVLNHALRAHLGTEADQRGSLVADDRLRFDVSTRTAPDTETIAAIEQHVSDMIAGNLSVQARECPLEVAQRMTGVRAVFGERYPDPVRVVSIGPSIDELMNQPEGDWGDASIEFCGGTHLQTTGGIEDFVLTQEQGLAAGIRRVVAVTGERARSLRASGETLLQQVEQAMAADDASLEAHVESIARDHVELELGLVHRRRVDEALDTLRDRVKKVRKAASGESKAAAIDAARLLAEAGGDLIVGEVPAGDKDALLAAMDTVKGNCPEAACLLASRDDASVLIVARVPDAGIKAGLKAGDWVREVAKACGGGGGGRPDMAQAGGKNPDALPEALEKATTFAKEKLG